MKSSLYLKPEDISKYNLENLSVFQGLHLEDLEQILSVSKIKTFEVDETIIKSGSTDSWLYILLEGKAKIIVENTELTVIHEHGALFGETALIDNRPRQADVIAMSQYIKCLCIDVILMEEVLCTTNSFFYAHFYKQITGMLSTRIAATSAELALVKKAFAHILESD